MALSKNQRSRLDWAKYNKICADLYEGIQWPKDVDRPIKTSFISRQINNLKKWVNNGL